MYKKILLIGLCCSNLVFSQVGIKTNNPQELLHVNGTMRVEGAGSLVDGESLIGVDVDGNLTTVNLTNTLDYVNNELLLRRGVTYDIGTMDIGGITPSGPNYVHDLDLQLGPGEANEGKTVIKVYNTPQNIRITGIQDGVEGLHLFFYHLETKQIIFMDQTDSNSLLSASKNRINVLSSSETIAGKGSVEFIYDGTSQKWILLSFLD